MKSKIKIILIMFALLLISISPLVSAGNEVTLVEPAPERTGFQYIFSLFAVTGGCTDTDGGRDYYNKGITTSATGVILEDSCSTSIKLKEYFCDRDGGVLQVVFECENSCSNGACTETAPDIDTPPDVVDGPSCLDTDGTNYKLKGYIQGKYDDGRTWGPEYDYCTNFDSQSKSDTLIEMVCANGIDEDFDIYHCSDYGSNWECQSGKCVEVPIEDDSTEGCTEDTDCASNEFCLGGVCYSIVSTDGCFDNFDCSSGEVCINSICEVLEDEEEDEEDKVCCRAYIGGTYNYYLKSECDSDNYLTIVDNSFCEGIEPKPTGVTCIDSDGGIKPDEYGIVSFGGAGEGILDDQPDICLGEDVREAYCDGNENKFKRISCSGDKLCSKGKCVSGDDVQNTCSDEDGENYYRKSYVVGFEEGLEYKKEDNCLNENILNEYICEGITPKVDIKICENGCINGKCISKEEKKQISLTSSEWKKATNKQILNSMCEEVGECSSREDYEIECISSPEIKEKNEEAWEELDPVGQTWDFFCEESWVLAGFGWGLGLCQGEKKVPDGTCRATLPSFDWNQEVFAGILMWQFLIGLGAIIFIVIMVTKK